MKNYRFAGGGLAVASVFTLALATYSAQADDAPATRPSAAPATVYTPPPTTTQPISMTSNPASTQPVLVGGPTISSQYQTDKGGQNRPPELHSIQSDPRTDSGNHPADIQHDTGVGVNIGPVGPNAAAPSRPINPVSTPPTTAPANK